MPFSSLIFSREYSMAKRELEFVEAQRKQRVSTEDRS